VAKACYRHSFALKSFNGIARISVNAQDPFQSNDALRISLAGAIDHAHSAAPDFLKDLIIANPPFGTAHINFVQHVIPFGRIFPITLQSLLKNTI
jgi:hypothetical protein